MFSSETDTEFARQLVVKAD